jgi:hypothetical protein
MTKPLEMKCYSLILLFSVTCRLFAQSWSEPSLERRVTINADNQTIESVMDKMTSQSGVVFSYNSAIIDTWKSITCYANNKPVRFVLLQILGSSYTFKSKGKYVIIQKNEPDNNSIMLQGYVYDMQTGERLSNASVYDKTLMASAVTDKYGYFSMKLPAMEPITSVQVSKAGYADTSIAPAIAGDDIKALELALNSESGKPGYVRDFLKMSYMWMIPRNIRANSINIKETWPKTFQLSLVPGVSTNKMLGGSVDNMVSVNILGGYSQSVRIFEFGGIFNLVRDSMSYCQVGGISNFVGGSLTGVQLGGIYNRASSVNGVQVSGVANTVKRDAKMQFAGIINKASSADLQIAGVVNTVEKSGNIQIGGIINISDSSSLQIAGILNRTTYLKGFQLALINMADSSEGTSVGLINLIRNGYHKIELSSDEILHTNLNFRTGTRLLHIILGTGIAAFNNDRPVWGVSYGVGTSLGKSGKYAFDLDGTTTRIYYHGDTKYNQEWYSIYAGIDRKLIHHFSLAAGITFNFLITDKRSDYYNDIYSGVTPYNLVNSDFSTHNNLKSWVGVKLGLRFL